MSVVEVRIHGVSGTPPDAMLATDPVLVEERAGGDIGVYRPPVARQDLRAYRWSSLTSGSWKAAFWIALLPFMLCNVAGFALPKMGRRRTWMAVTVVRLCGIGLTMILALVTAQGFIDVGSYQYLHGRLGRLGATSSVALGALVASGFLAMLWGKLSRSGAPPVPVAAGDPAGRHPLTDRRMWEAYRFETDLRSLHLAVALGSIGWVAYDVLIGLEANLPGWLVAGWRWVVPATLGCAIAATLAGRPRWWGRIAVMGVGAALCVMALVAAFGDAGVEPVDLTLSKMEMSLTVAALTALVMILTGVTATAGTNGNGFAAPALIAIAGASGASVGAALIQIGARATGAVPPHWIENLAVGYLSGILTIGVVTALFLLVMTPAAGDRAVVRLFTAVRRLRHRLHLVLITVLVVTASITVGFVGDRFDLWEFAIPAIVPSGLATGLVTLVAVWCLRLGLKKTAWILVAGSVVVTVLAVGGLLDREGVLGWSFTGYQATAVAVTVVLPLGLMFGRMLGAVRDRDQRRGLAVAWDVGSFFPRWHHPFAPPAYGAQAVTDLADYLTRERRGEAAVIVAPHSQGTVVAVAALALLGDLGGDIALLTYGSPVGSLYRRFFPGLFDDIVENLGGLEDRWVNLFRCDDPIAGPIGGTMDRPPLDDPAGRVHAAYWFEPEYVDAIHRLRRLIQTG